MAPWPKDHVKKTRVFSVRVTEEQMLRLEKLADKRGTTVRFMVAKAIDELVKVGNDKKNQ